jgi:glycosyltransferase involved in cell wall biosynthesis
VGITSERTSIGVSACLIVRDEAARLRDCLESLRDFVTEIVVADTGSQDDTISIALEYGARVLCVPWRDSFAAARNAALAACWQPWVLSIDADERAVGVGHWLPQMLEVLDDKVSALSVPVSQAGVHDPRGVLTHREVKLFRRDRITWAGRVHERPLALDGMPLRAVELPEQVLRLVHHGYADPEIAAVKAARNARLAELQLSDLTATAADHEAIAAAALDLGRSQISCGLRDSGRRYLSLSRSESSHGSQAWLWATDFLFWDTVSHARDNATTFVPQLKLAHALLAELIEVGIAVEYQHRAEAALALLHGDLATARELLESIGEPRTVVAHLAAS